MLLAFIKLHCFKLGKSKEGNFFLVMSFGKLGGQVKRQIFERDKRIEFEQLKMNAEKLKQLIIAKNPSSFAFLAQACFFVGLPNLFAFNLHNK
jgi:hypothetical protein